MKYGTVLLYICILLAAVSAPGYAGGFTITAVRGSVSVRHGVDEKWVRCDVGNTLNPADAIELAAGASAVLRNDDGVTVRLPQGVIVELSDLRNMTAEELSLRIAMDQIRALPPREQNDSFGFPRTTSVHGASAEKSSSSAAKDLSAGTMELNGARVLYDHGYFGTCVLRARNVFKRYPSFADNAELRLVVARSFESLGMKGEALNEYTGILALECSPEMRSVIDGEIVKLRQR